MSIKIKSPSVGLEHLDLTPSGHLLDRLKSVVSISRLHFSQY